MISNIPCCLKVRHHQDTVYHIQADSLVDLNDACSSQKHKKVTIFAMTSAFINIFFLNYFRFLWLSILFLKEDFIRKNFARKLNSDWTKLGLYLILGPQEVTPLISSTTDMNPTSTPCDRQQTLAVP